MDLSPYLKIDNTLFALSKSLNLLKYVHATNYFRQKRYFLKGKLKKPKFNYRKISYNTKRIERILKDLQAPDTKLGKLFKKSIDILKVNNEIIKNIDKPGKIIKYSSQLYGKPAKSLIKKAKKLLEKNNYNKYERGIYSSKEVKRKILEQFKKIGLKDWNVRITRKSTASISSTYKNLRLYKNKLYSKKEYERIKVHEVHGHIFRAENGYLQPFKIFATGLPNYLSTEEGIAAYLEEKHKVESPESKRRFALRVLAVDSVYCGATFHECFHMLTRYEPDMNRCWHVTYRAFRGGGFLKDHVYLEGYYKIKNYLKRGGKLKSLYYGKIGLEHLKICKELQSEGLLVSPKYLP
jgi:uncharacterized protein (TIGR02421 family)